MNARNEQRPVVRIYENAARGKIKIQVDEQYTWIIGNRKDAEQYVKNEMRAKRKGRGG